MRHLQRALLATILSLTVVSRAAAQKQVSFERRAASYPAVVVTGASSPNTADGSLGWDQSRSN
jgi:hypothetical protein